MKKLTIFVALILCVTIGGVYAAWNYAQGTVDESVVYFDNLTSITTAVTTTEKGEITVDTSNLTISIDDATNDFYGELVIEGYITVTFTPSAGVDTSVAQNGIAMQYAIGVTENWNYSGNAIFNVNTTTQALNNGVACKTVTIQAEELKTLITLNELHLPTAQDHANFRNALHGGSLLITVNEVPVVTPAA